MTQDMQERRSDLVLMVVVFSISAIMLVASLQLPPSRFDPLGPGAFPVGICTLLLLLSGIGIGKVLRGRSLGRAETSLLTGIGEQVEYRQHPWLAASLYLGTVVYVAVLQFTPVGFMGATAAYVTIAGIALSRNALPRTLLTAATVGVCTSAVLSYIFTELLTVALP